MGGARGASSAIPRLGTNLKTFVINLERRADRRESIERVCRELQLDYEVVAATDGRALAQSPGACLEMVDVDGKQKQAQPSAATTPDGASADSKPRGFGGLRIRRYRARWVDDAGRPRSQLLSMAEHRLRATEHTGYGHELWGAVGCSLSHQTVLRRIEGDGVEWALVLEDDATLAMTADSVRKAFAQGMTLIARHCPEWELVYLGGHLSSKVKEENEEWRMAVPAVELTVQSAREVYQTHAFVVRRSLVPVILRRLECGFAADAALASWSRKALGRCFLFHPQQLMRQPGGAKRWKDSDIFVEGEIFKAHGAKLADGRYSFTGCRDDKSLIPREPTKKLAPGRSMFSEVKAAHRAWREASSQLSALTREAPWVAMPCRLDLEHAGALDALEVAAMAPKLRTVLEDLKRGFAVVSGMQQAALRASVDAVGPRWRVRVSSAALGLYKSSSQVSASPLSATERDLLSAAVRCVLQFTLGHGESLANAAQVALRTSPEDRCEDDERLCERVCADLEFWKGPADANASDSGMLEASVLHELLGQLTHTGVRLQTVDKASAALDQLETAAAENTSVAARSGDKKETPSMAGSLAGDQAEQRGYGDFGRAVCAGAAVEENEETPSSRRQTLRRMRHAMMEESPPKRKRLARTVDQGANAGGDASQFEQRRALASTLVALPIAELRALARRHRVDPFGLATCLEKRDVADVIVEAMEKAKA